MKAPLSRRLILAGALGVLATPVALAHRAQSVLTTVEWNAARSTLEVIHRIHVSDAEAGLARDGGAPAADMRNGANQARLALYVSQRFALSDATGKLKLDMIGAELDADIVLIHQEAKLAHPPAELVVEDRILGDVFEGQTNLVNLRISTRTRTLIFAGGDGPKRVRDLL